MKVICRAKLDDKGHPLEYFGCEYYLTLTEQAEGEE